MRPEVRVPTPPNPRSLKNLLLLVGSYLLVGATIYGVVYYMAQHDYGSAAWFIFFVLFFGFGCVLGSIAAIRGSSPGAVFLGGDEKRASDEHDDDD